MTNVFLSQQTDFSVIHAISGWCEKYFHYFFRKEKRETNGISKVLWKQSFRIDIKLFRYRGFEIEVSARFSCF